MSLGATKPAEKDRVEQALAEELAKWKFNPYEKISFSPNLMVLANIELIQQKLMELTDTDKAQWDIEHKIVLTNILRGMREEAEKAEARSRIVIPGNATVGKKP